jgi:cardiolipin synthase (CMP-forming)
MQPTAASVLDRLGRMAGTDRIQVSSKILTIPNVLSFIRLAMVPVFLVLIIIGADLAALIVLVISSATDYLDGQIARRFGQVTRLGQLLDPAADRLFIFAALVGLCVREIIPWWLVVAIVGRDFVLAILGIILANHGYGPLPVHHLGKVATFSLLYALPILMLGLAFPVINWITNPVGWAFALWGAFLYWWAGVVYIIETARVVRIPQGAQVPASDTLGA